MSYVTVKYFFCKIFHWHCVYVNLSTLLPQHIKRADMCIWHACIFGTSWILTSVFILCVFYLNMILITLHIIGCYISPLSLLCSRKSNGLFGLKTCFLFIIFGFPVYLHFAKMPPLFYFSLYFLITRSV